jgi:hypothetical protein
MPRAVKGRY